MSIYHCTIKIINRAGGRSAVSSAAYRSGEKLRNEETGIIHDFTRKGGVAYSEIMLPSNAPSSYSNRELLWNEVQKVESRSDAQLAREVEAALPVEMTRDEQLSCVRTFVKKNFVDEGMIADWALHDKGDGNPHVHIMLTVRGIDESTKWMQKQKTVFANERDESGRAIYNPDLPSYDSKNREATAQYRIPVLDDNGKQKTRVRKGKGTEYLWEKISIPINDWNDHSKAEIWRKSWAEECNKYLSEDKIIDHRSYARQGIDKEATIHEGVTARRMEKDGNISERCEINREVRKRNNLREEIAKITKEIKGYIMEKVRDLYDTVRGLSGVPKDIGKAKPVSEIGYRDRRRKQRTDGETRTQSGTNRGIGEYKQFVNESEQEIAGTSEKIAITDRRIDEIRKRVAKREEELNEQIRELILRRKASEDRFANRNAGRDRGITALSGNQGESIATERTRDNKVNEFETEGDY